MENKKKIKFIVYTALFIALGIILNFIEIPYILVPWLKLDISEVITLLATTFSLFSGIIVAFAKGIFMVITGTTTGFIGEITLIIGSLTVVLIYYLSKKVMKEIPSLIIVSLTFTIMMVLLNYFYMTPFYFGNVSWQTLSTSTQEITLFNTTISVSYLSYILIMYVPFNLIKMLLDCTIYYFINKKLQKVL
ncbi:MAG: ECF transporter S component [Mycoplasmatales bacterium]